MAGLFGAQAKQPQAQQPAAAAGISVQTSTYGKVISVVVGTAKASPNLIDYGNFVATAHSSGGGGGGGGGKGGGGGNSGGGTTSYTYSAMFAFGLCQGPIAGVGTVWSAKTETNAAALGLTVFDGTQAQAPFAWLASQATVTEEHTIPSSAPYQVTVNWSGTPVVDYGVVDAQTGDAFVAPSGAEQTLSVPAPTSSPYQVAVGSAIATDGGVYDADMDQDLYAVTGTPSGYEYSVNLATGVYTFSPDIAGNALEITWAPSTSTALQGQYLFSGGTYTFNAADAGTDITISYTSGNQEPPSRGLTYSYLAYAAASAFDLGDSPNSPNNNFEIYGFYHGSVASAPLEADPSLFVAGILTNPRWGVGTLFPASGVGNLTGYQAYTIASGLCISACYSEQQTVAQVLDDLATYTNADVAITDTLTLIPKCDQAITANGVTFTPPAGTFSLGDDDWLANNAAATTSGTGTPDPLVVNRARPDTVTNQVTLEYLNRANQYAPETVTARDVAAIRRYGLKTDKSKQAHMFANGVAARVSAQLLVQDAAAANTWQGTVGEDHIAIDIGDRGWIASAVQNVSSRYVKVTNIAEQSDCSLAITFKEILTGGGTAAAHGFASGQGSGPNYSVDPGDSAAPIIIEPPYALANDLELWIGTCGGPDWGGCQVWISTDNATFALAGSITGAARMGSLMTALPAGADPDITDTLAVDLSQSRGTLLSGTRADADSLSTLCWVNGEFVAYQTATLTATSKYQLTYLRRGAYGVPASQHLAGSPFIRLDNAVLKLTLTRDRIGQTIWVKLLSFNSFGGGMQQLSDVSATSYFISGVTPPAIDSVTAQLQANGSVKVAWVYTEAPMDLAGINILVNGAVVEAGVSGSSFTTSAAVLAPIGTYTIGVEAVNIAGLTSAVTSTSFTRSLPPVASVTITHLADGTNVVSWAYPLSPVDWASSIVTVDGAVIAAGVTGYSLATASASLRSPGTHQVGVQAVDACGNSSVATYASYTYALPPDVTNFALNPIAANAFLTWDANPAIDVAYYEIRFTPLTSGATWSGASDLVPNVAAPGTSVSVALASGTYLIRATNMDGYQSPDAALVVNTIVPVGLNFVETITESPTFAGTVSNCDVTPSGLQLASQSPLADWMNLVDVPSLTFGGALMSMSMWGNIASVPYLSENNVNGVVPSGTYTFSAANTVDLGSVFTPRLSAAMTVAGDNITSVLAGWAELGQQVTLAGATGAGWSAVMQVRTTQTATSGSPTWSAWQNLTVGDYTARGFQFRVLLTSNNPSVTPLVTALAVSFQLPSRTLSAVNVSAPAGGQAVTFSTPFYVTPAVNITANGMATGDYFTVTAKSSTGFTVQFFNAAGTGVARSFDWLASAY